MSTWNLTLGMVKHWNDENFKHETVYMEMEYDANASMPITIECVYNDIKSIQTSSDLSVKKIQSPWGNVEICGDIYDFTDEQIALIESVMPYWTCQEDMGIQTEYGANYGTNIYLGLVMYYDTDIHEFVLSDLEINREPESSVFMKIKEYDLTTKMVTKLITPVSTDWEASFEGFQEELQLYKICGCLFLLNDSQADYIDSI